MQIESPGAARADNGANINRIVIHLSDRAMSVIAIILASLAIGILLMMVPFIDAKVLAGGARAEATANAAQTNARLALDYIERAEIELGKKGIDIHADGH